jgi:hypothetical protein
MNIEYLWTIYLASKRSHYKQPFIKRGKKDKDEDMEKVARIVDELKCDPAAYIEFTIKSLSPLRIFPSPAHLASDKAKARYQIHMAMMGVYNTEWYYIEHDNFTVKKSYKTYRLKDVEAKGMDPDEAYVSFLSNHPEVDFRDSLDKIFYVEAKYHYLMKGIPDGLALLFSKADEEVVK